MGISYPFIFRITFVGAGDILRGDPLYRPRVPRCGPAILWPSPSLQVPSVVWVLFFPEFSEAVFKLERYFKDQSGRKPEAPSRATQSILWSGK